MEMMKKELKWVETMVRYCDICGEEASGRTCCMCKRDVCEKHSHRVFEEATNHSLKYCTECWKMGSPHRDEIARIYDVAAEDSYVIRAKIEEIGLKNSEQKYFEEP